MSRTKPDRFERMALITSCYVCDAPSNQWCVVGLWYSGSRRWAGQLHAGRVYDELAAAWWQGYNERKAEAS